MKVVDRKITFREAGGRGDRTVAFIYENGQQALVEVSAANSVGFSDNQLIQHAEKLLTKVDVSARGDLPPYAVGDNSNLVP